MNSKKLSDIPEEAIEDSLRKAVTASNKAQKALVDEYDKRQLKPSERVRKAIVNVKHKEDRPVFMTQLEAGIDEISNILDELYDQTNNAN